MNTVNIQVYQAPQGALLLGAYENKLCLCDWQARSRREAIDRRIQVALDAHYVTAKCDLLDQAALQLDEYFQHQRQQFDLPLQLIGSAFQQAVWHALLQIPYASTRSYLDLAKAVDNEKAVRAVASANGANAISIIIPCHRVIANNGHLSGYAGGVDAKKALITFEQSRLL